MQVIYNKLLISLTDFYEHTIGPKPEEPARVGEEQRGPNPKHEPLVNDKRVALQAAV